MLNGAGVGEWVAGSLAGAVAVVAALLVYRDARRHGNYHALSATAAVAITGLVGYAVGGVVGLFVGTGSVLLLYILSYPTTPSIDPRGPRGDAGENIASEESGDTLSVIRVEVATYETLKELAERYADVSADAPEAKLRSALRAKALSEIDPGSSGPGAVDTRPHRGLTDPDAPAARASEYGIEEWLRDSATAPAEHAEEPGIATCNSESNDDEAAAEGDTPEQSADHIMSQRDDGPTSEEDRATDDLPERNDELAADAQQWVATNVDRELGVTVGEALDTPDVHDGSGENGVSELNGEEQQSGSAPNDTAAWSADEPPAETATEQTVADWSDDSTTTNVAEASTGTQITADTGSSTPADTAATGGVWESACETTEQPDSEQTTGMVFDNAVERQETDGENQQVDSASEPASNETEPDSSSAQQADSSSAQQADSSSEQNDESDTSGDDDPFDGRGELYDGDDTYDEEEESRY